MNRWQWIDGNEDGTAECYYFNLSGYCLINTVTPDGYFVDANGAWIVNGIVQTQSVEASSQSVAKEEDSNDWINTGGESDGSERGNMGLHAGQMVSDSDIKRKQESRPASRVDGGNWFDYNRFLFHMYGRKFLYNNGIGLNQEERGKIAKILPDTSNGFGIQISGWRKSYDSDIATNRCLNMVLEAFYYACGDRYVAYALWSVTDYLAINGSAATTIDVIEGFGFTASNETNNSIDLSMNGINIYWTWENGKNTFTFK